MIRWPRLRRKGRVTESHTKSVGPEILFAELAKARLGMAYDSQDRRRDFHSVFFGSDAGKRVLYELLAWSHIFASTFVPGDPHATHWREGGRDVGLRILTVLNPEPPVPSVSVGAAVETSSEKEA